MQFLKSVTPLTLIPFQLQQRVALDLKTMSNIEAFALPDRAHAAMFVASFYSFGFGVTHDIIEVAQWIYRASKLGSSIAAAWYPRICSANNIDPIQGSHLQPYFELDAKLNNLDSNSYLSNRVHMYIQAIIQQIKTNLLAGKQLLSFDPSEHIMTLHIFNHQEPHELLPLHVGALIGDDTSVSILLDGQDGKVLSSQGFTAVHYACLGGHLSTLQLLLSHSSSTNTVDSRGITPIHLCVCFVGADAGTAASLLLDSGSDPKTRVSECIDWEYHDIALLGTALDWATRIRHRHLVERLLPLAQDDSCLRIAVRNFFWDIAEIILRQSRELGNIRVRYARELSELSIDEQYLANLVSPFGHWIAHGPSHLTAMEKTVQLSMDEHIVAREGAQHVALAGIVDLASFEDDFALIVFCATKLPPEVVKSGDERGQVALTRAFLHSRNLPVWREPLEAIMKVYTVEELGAKAESFAQTFDSHLTQAIASDSVIGVRLLLEKGVNCTGTYTREADRFDAFFGKPLLEYADLPTSDEMHSLLKNYIAESDLENINGDRRDMYRLLVKRPNKDLLRSVLAKTDSQHIGDALHHTLYFATLLPSIDGFLKAEHSDVIPSSIKASVLWKELERINYKFIPKQRSFVIHAKADELNLLWSGLEGMTDDQKFDLQRLLGTDQLSSLLGYMNLDPQQRPKSLEIVGSIRVLESLMGVDEAQRVLEQDNGVIIWTPATSQPEQSRLPQDDVLDASRLSEPKYWQELFKIQLSLDNWVKSINDTDKTGATMLQKAAFHLSVECVSLLLEAGADASIPFAIKGNDAQFPLQMACTLGRVYQLPVAYGGHPGFNHFRKRSMDVAMKLLQWHHTRADGLFLGITESHLAYRMLLPFWNTEYLPSDGYLMTAEGHWPGIHTPVKPVDLVVGIADDEWLLDINADHMLVGMLGGHAWRWL